MQETHQSAQQVLDFWFSDAVMPCWFVKSDAFDRRCKSFENTLTAAVMGECAGWRETMAGRLAEIIVLDQLSRNLFRNTPRAFSQDAMALALAQEAVKQPDYTALAPLQRKFVLMPYMHSESKVIHQQAIPLFEALNDAETLDFEWRHKAIIDRFGRYPHRNAVLDRISTPAEIDFLTQARSSF
ncbi:hypothetical protein A1D23_02715 [Chelonobacter oris]|uniref:Membrane protein n=1 Tax=Chelonobacter oris TaxID=505317 RepID=A0A0A3APS7_9PAST|nr:DUF924 family protein [Chelonobacter oris]KGQ69752.1 membrane protein [Chelonobacter oris]MDH3001490.1 hypothetical protein [Chelonobacter oris]